MGAQRRYEFIKKLIEEEEHPPGPDEDKAATHRTSTVIVDSEVWSNSELGRIFVLMSNCHLTQI